MIAKKITVARQEKKEIIHKLELQKLSSTALNKVAQNYMLYPELKGLDHKSKLKVSVIISSLGVRQNISGSSHRSDFSFDRLRAVLAESL